MIINHNLSSINANRSLTLNSVTETKNMEALSSGLRISRAADDAAGLAVSEKMRSQIRGLNQAIRNINDGVSFIQTTEGYLQGSTDAVQRIRELAVQAANGIYSSEDRQYMQVEVDQLIAEVDRIASQAQFNGMNLLTGRFDGEKNGSSMVIHMGANRDQNSAVNIKDMSSLGIGLSFAFNEGVVAVQTQEQANSSLGMVDFSLQLLNRQRADLGAYQNRMELAVKSQMIGYENLSRSESQIRDLNMAVGTVNLTRTQILKDANVAVLAQANQKTTSILRLLQ